MATTLARRRHLAYGLGLAAFLASGAAASQPAPTAVEQRPPVLTRFVPAAYPDGLRGAAEVLLEIEIDAQGRVTAASVVQSAGDAFDGAALAAARAFEFSPALQQGQPVAARIRYRYRFEPPPAPGEGVNTAPSGAPDAAPSGPAAVLRGVVRGGGERAVPDAVVILREPDGATRTQRTDASGAFRFELARAGSFQVEVDAPGFARFQSTERVDAAADVRAIYRLSAAGERPRRGAPARGGDDEEGLTVVGERPRREVSRTTLAREEIVRVPGTLGDALRSLQNLPGLARPPILSGSLIVRGSSPNDSQVLVDGTTLPMLYHFGGLGSVLPTDMLDRIDFYPGNFSARFGRATGGVVDVGLRAPTREGARAGGNIGLLDASAFAEAAVTRTLSVAVGARFAWGGFLASPFVNLFTPTRAFVGYWDYQSVIEWRPTGRDDVRVALFGSSDSVAVFTPYCSDGPGCGVNGSGATVQQGFHLAQLSWVHRFGPATQSRVMVSGGWMGLRVGNQLVEHGVSSELSAELSSVPITTRYELSHALSRYARIDVGLDAVFGPRNFHEGGFAGFPTVNQSTPVVQPGAYLEAELTPLRNVRIVPGVRVDYAQSVAQAVVQPRLSARWEVLRGWTLKGGVGYYAQPPLSDRVTVPPELLLFNGQIPPTLAPRFERAVHSALGIEHDFSRWISLSVEGYYKSITDALVGFPSIDLALAGDPSAMGSSAIRSDGVGRAYGVEVLLRHRMSQRFFGWVAYSFSRAERRDSPTSDWRPFEFDQTHNLVVLASYNLGAGWEVGARFRYVTGRPTSLTQVVYDTNTGTYLQQPAIPWAARVFDFHELDVRIEKTWRHAWGSVSLYLDVLNVYNRYNAEQYRFSPDGTQSLPAGPFLPIFPNLGVRGQL